jgi:hypothetical protein
VILEKLLILGALSALSVGCGRSGDAQRTRATTSASEEAPAAARSDVLGKPNRMLDAARFDDPRAKAAYAAARQYASVLEGLYCYCRCRENMGHRALAECFESEHGSKCDICQTEALVAARMASGGRSVREIQKAIDAYYAS